MGRNNQTEKKPFQCDVCFRDKPNLFFFDLVTCLTKGASLVTNGCPTPQVGTPTPCHMLMTNWQKY